MAALPSGQDPVNGNSAMSVHQIWAAVATVFVIVAAVVTTTLFGRDPSTLMLVVTAVVSPVVSALVVTQKLTQLQSRVDTVDQKVDGVDTKVNGHLTEITKKIPDAVSATVEETP